MTFKLKAMRTNSPEAAIATIALKQCQHNGLPSIQIEPIDAEPVEHSHRAR